MCTFGGADIERIQAETDLVRLVQRYVTLEPTGSQWRGSCPFHDDTFGAFYVVPGKGFFKCFGCGEGGGCFRFLARIERITFPQAVRWLGWELCQERCDRGD